MCSVHSEFLHMFMEYRDSTSYFKKLTVNSGYLLTNCQEMLLERISLWHQLSFKKERGEGRGEGERGGEREMP